MDRMKRIISVGLGLIIAVQLFGCSNANRKDEYTMNMNYSYGSLEDNQKLKVSYDVIITGSEEALKKVRTCELVIDDAYTNLLVDYNENTSLDESTIELEGTYIFDASQLSKEQLEEQPIFNELRLLDKQTEKIKSYELN